MYTTCIDESFVSETKSTSKNKTPKFIRKSTWSDTQTEWFDAKAEQDQSTPSESSAGDPSTNKPISTKSKTKTKSKSKSEDQDAQEEEEDHSASPLPVGTNVISISKL